MWLGLTIARSSPASTQWCRKTELSTARARGETPKETLDTPREVFPPGSAALTPRTPSIVAIERGLYHLGLGRVDLDRRRLGERHALDDLAHLRVLVRALGQGHAHVEHVGAALDLVLGHLHEAVVVVGQQQLLGLPRALRVHAL